MGISGHRICTPFRIKKRLDRLLGVLVSLAVLLTFALSCMPGNLTTVAAQAEAVVSDEAVSEQAEDTSDQSTAPIAEDAEDTATTETPASEESTDEAAEEATPPTDDRPSDTLDAAPSENQEEALPEHDQDDVPTDALSSEPVVPGAVGEESNPSTSPEVSLFSSQEGWLGIDVGNVQGPLRVVVTMHEGVFVDSSAIQAAVFDASVMYVTSGSGLVQAVVEYPVESDCALVVAGCRFLSCDYVTLVDGNGNVCASASVLAQDAYAAAEEGISSALLADGDRSFYLHRDVMEYYPGHLAHYFQVNGLWAQCANPDKPSPEPGFYQVIDPSNVPTGDGQTAQQYWWVVRNLMYYGPDGPGFEWAKQNGIWPSQWYDGTPITDGEIAALQWYAISDNVFNLWGATSSHMSWEFKDYYERYVGGYSHTTWSWEYMDATVPVLAGYNDQRPVDDAPSWFDVFMLYTGDATQFIVGMQWEENPTATLAIQKASAQPDVTDGNGCYSLEGAVYELYDSDGGVAATLVTRSDGSTEKVEVPTGVYTCKEVSAPLGYALDDTEYTLDLTETGRDYVIPHADVPQYDIVPLVVQKVDAASGLPVPSGDASFDGAVFEVSYYAGSYDIDNLPDSPTRRWSISTGADGMATLDDEHLVEGDAFYTAPDGTAALPLGTVVVRETQAPQGYTLSEDANVLNIDGDGLGSQYVETNLYTTVSQAVGLCGLALDKVDDTNGSAQGDATLQGAQFDIVNASRQAVFVGGSQIDPGQVALTVVTDAGGHARTGLELPYGTYTVVEVQPPRGYHANPSWSQTVTLHEAGTTRTLTPQEQPHDTVVRGGLSVEKRDAQTGLPQGDATLAGAVIDIENASEHPVVVDGVTYTPGRVVATLTTDANGRAATAPDALPYGTYLLTERAAPDGYLLGDGEPVVVEVRSQGMSDETVVFQNQAILGAVGIVKVDRELATGTPLGAAALDGAVYQLSNASIHPVMVDGVVYNPGSVVLTLTTDAEGLAQTHPVLPYGTYLLTEVSAPRGYLLDTQRAITVSVRDQGVTLATDEDGNTFSDQVVRGDFRFVKVDEDNMARMGGVPFKVTSVTTGEWHVLVSDENGTVDTSASWNPHSAATNANDAAYITESDALTTGGALSYFVDETRLNPRAGVWFSGAAGTDTHPNDALGALPFDTYTIEELRCSANEGHRLVSFNVTVTRDGVVIDLGTVDDKAAPAIATQLTDENGSHAVYADGTVTLIDQVGYTNLAPGTYTLFMELVFSDTGEPVTDALGERVVAQTEFHSVSSHGSENVTVQFDASALAGRKVVAFESLLQDGSIVAEHKDLTDEYQTVSIEPRPSVTTTLTDEATGTHGSSSLGTIRLVDRVEYEHLRPGIEYTVSGELRNQTTGEAVLVDGRALTSTASFVPQSPNGFVDVVFEFDATGLAGCTVVAFETLYEKGVAVAVHADITDEAQSVSLPSMSTTLTDESGSHDVGPYGTTTLIDLVEYTGLIPGATYELRGELYDGETGALVTANGTAVKSVETFVPEESSGSVTMTFVVDTSALAGKRVVAFEELLLGEVAIARHADLASQAQSVYVGALPSIRTTLTDTQGNHSVGGNMPVELVDTVSFDNLDPQTEYVLRGALMHKDTGQPVVDENDEPLVSTVSFTPDDASGEQQVFFTVDPVLLGLGGTDIVAFEYLLVEYEGEETLLTSHEDLSDTSQTVSFAKPYVATTLTNTSGEKVVAEGGAVTLVDTVTYEGLDPGVSHVLVGTLVDKATAKPVADSQGNVYTSTIAFTPSDSSGTVEVVFDVDATPLAGKSLVAFETLARMDDGSEVARHADPNDAAQTVLFSPRLSTTLTDRGTGNKVAETLEAVELVDTVVHEGLTVGERYTIEGKLVRTDGTLFVDAAGQRATSVVSFVPQTESGQVEVPFAINASRMSHGDRLVAFETLYDEAGRVVASHADLGNPSQTVSFARPDTPQTPTPSLVRTGDETASMLPFVIAGATLVLAACVLVARMPRL